MDKETLRTLARETMDAHGLEEWELRIDSARIRAGQTTRDRAGRVRRISLSAPIAAINSDAEVLDTILHECAHALAPFGSGHSWKWRRQFLAIGGSGEAHGTYNHIPTPIKWVGECAVHGVVSEYKGMPRKRRSCSKCRPYVFDPQFLLTIRKATS